MSDENKVTENEKCNCFCKSEGFRKFLIIACGSFVGVYLALSLFAATHKPPMMRHHHFPPRFHNGCPCVMMHHFKRFDNPENIRFEKQIPQDAQKRTPFEVQK